jgi:MFS superfamily sulfate permease-like transporter
MRNKNIFKTLQESWQKDLLSGFLVSLIALPLCLGIAGASGFPPIMGVMTAIVGGMIVSFFAGSELTIKGPAAGLIVIVFEAVEEFANANGGDTVLGWKLALGVVVVAGIIQVILGVLKVASVVEFFPLSAVHGMLAAIGIIIISKQIHLADGFDPSLIKGKNPLQLLEMIPESLTHLTWQIALIGGVSLVILFGMPLIKNKIIKQIPPALVVLIVGVVLGLIENIGGREFANLKPLVNVGDLKFDFNASFAGLSGPNLTIFIKNLILFVLIGSLESLLSGKAIDLLDPKHRKSNLNKDLTAVGIGNIISGLLGGLPMISEIARSSANINNGGQTRWANFFHGAFLLIFVVLLVPIIKMVPVASLAAMLIFVGFRLAAPKEFIKTYKIGPEQLIVFIGTVIITITTDLLIGIFSGIVIEWLIHFIWGVPIKDYFKQDLEVKKTEDHKTLFILYGSGLFSNYLKVHKKLVKINKGETIEFDVQRVRLLDHTFLEKLTHFAHDYENDGGKFVFLGMDKLSNLSNHPMSDRMGTKGVEKILN